LAQLDLNGTNRSRVDDLLEALEIEAALVVPASEISSADLQDQFTIVAMMGRNSSFTGVMQACR